MPRNPTAVQTPGETPTAPAADAFQAVGTDLSGAEPTGADDNSEVAELRALVQRQNEQMSALMGAVTQLQANQTRQAPTPKQSQEAALPDIADLNLESINKGDTPVLTKQGWIVPPKFAGDPRQLAEEAQKEADRQAQAEDRVILRALVSKLSTEG